MGTCRSRSSPCPGSRFQNHRHRLRSESERKVSEAEEGRERRERESATQLTHDKVGSEIGIVSDDGASEVLAWGGKEDINPLPNNV